jgi:hypothetical protein
MLIEKDLKDKEKSWYICDRCGNKLTGISRKIVCINNIKQWDLCKRCCNKVKKYVEGNDDK